MFEEQHGRTVPGATISEELVRCGLSGTACAQRPGREPQYRISRNNTSHTSPAFSIGREFSCEGLMQVELSMAIPGRYPCYFPEKSRVELVFVP